MQDSFLNQLIFLGLPLLAIWYFLLIKPQQQQQKKLKAMLEGLKKNDEVVTASGIHGVVVIVKDKTVVLRVDDNCRIEFDKEVVTIVKSNTVKPEVVK
ncbi:MAG: preprotein translocase subunit YajC [Candidatus Omnitrophota bacterium]